MDTSSDPFLHLMGKAGSISIDRGRHKFFAEHADEPIEEEISRPIDAANERDLLSQHFIECIRENKELIIPAMSDLVNNLVLEAITESSRTGCDVAARQVFGIKQKPQASSLFKNPR